MQPTVIYHRIPSTPVPASVNIDVTQTESGTIHIHVRHGGTAVADKVFFKAQQLELSIYQRRLLQEQGPPGTVTG